MTRARCCLFDRRGAVPVRLAVMACVLTLRAVAAQQPAVGGWYRESHALVVGISDYSAGWADLPSVESELAAVAQALREQGFTVRRLRNPGGRELHSAYRRFIDDHGYDPDNRLLFYFSGHGYSRRQGKLGYVVPADAPLPTSDLQGFLRHALPMNQLIAWARGMEARHALFVFDSCFSGTIFKTRALQEAFDPALLSHPTRQFLTAGDAGEEVPAKSVFTPVFVRGIAGQGDLNGDHLVTGSELGIFMRDKVMGYATGQTPQFGRLTEAEFAVGDFVFRPSGHAPPTLPQAEPSLGAAPRPDSAERRELDLEAARVDALKRELARLRVERHGDGSAHSVATVYLLKASEMSLAAGQTELAQKLVRQVMRIEPNNPSAIELYAKLRDLARAEQLMVLEREARAKAAALAPVPGASHLAPLRQHLVGMLEQGAGDRERRLRDFMALERAFRHQLAAATEAPLHAELVFSEPMNARVHCRGPFVLVLCNLTARELHVPKRAIKDLKIRIKPVSERDVSYIPPAPFYRYKLAPPTHVLPPFGVLERPASVQVSGLSRRPALQRRDGQPLVLPDGRYIVVATMEVEGSRLGGGGDTWSGNLELPPVEVISGALGTQPTTAGRKRVRVALDFGKTVLRAGEPVFMDIAVRNSYGEPFLADFTEALRTMTINFEPLEDGGARPFRLPSPFRTSRSRGPRPFQSGGNWRTATHFPPNFPRSYVGKRYRVHLELTFPESPGAWSGQVRSPAVEAMILPKE